MARFITALHISHDRHMLEMTADRLVLVDAGTAKDFDGSIEDYIAFVLAKDPGTARGGEAKGPVINKKDERRAAAEAREPGKALRDSAGKAEAELAKLTRSLSAVDHAMFDPSAAQPDLAKLAMSELMKRRAEIARQIEMA